MIDIKYAFGCNRQYPFHTSEKISKYAVEVPMLEYVNTYIYSGYPYLY